MQVSSSWHYCICFSLHCRLQLITAELAVLVLEEPWSGAFCHCQVQGLRGSLFSKQLRKDVELSFLLPGRGPWVYTLLPCLAWTPWVSDPKWKVSFILSNCRRSQVCATCWVKNRGEWNFSLLCIISWNTVKLERALLGSLGRSSNQEDSFWRLQEEQRKKEMGGSREMAQAAFCF